LRPGETALHLSGAAVRPVQAALEVPPSGADVTVRSPSRGGSIGAGVLGGLGAGALIPGALLLALGTTRTMWTYQGQEVPAPNDDGMVAGGAILTVAGSAMIIGAIALAVSNRGGFSSVRPKQQASLSVTPNLGLRRVGLGATVTF
jgi:hypothetical protein